MAQLDTELFIEYIFYIFLFLISMCSMFILRRTVLWLSSREAFIQTLSQQTRIFTEEQNSLKNIQTSFNRKF